MNNIGVVKDMCLNEIREKNIIDFFLLSSDIESYKMIKVSNFYFLNLFNKCFLVVLKFFWN